MPRVTLQGYATVWVKFPDGSVEQRTAVQAAKHPDWQIVTEEDAKVAPPEAEDTSSEARDSVSEAAAATEATATQEADSQPTETQATDFEGAV